MFGQAIVLLVSLAVGSSTICPPACNPPASITGCVRFRRASKCRQELITSNIAESECGCMWQEYILAVEPEANIIFTDGGEECYTWATIMCSEEERDESEEVAAEEIQQSIVDGINKLQKVLGDKSVIIADPGSPLAKHRRRDGAMFEVKQTEDGKSKVTAVQRKHPDLKSPPKHYNYIGKIHSDGELKWVDVSPIVDTKEAEKVSPEAEKDSESLLSKLEDEEFKMWVFLLILMMDVVVVLLAIFCTSDQKAEPKEVRPMGDLDPNMYIQNSPNKKKRLIGDFFQKLHTYKEKTGSKRSQYTKLEDGQAAGSFRRGSTSSQYDQLSQSTRRPSRGIYDDLINDATFHDNTYDEPVFNDNMQQSFQMPQGHAGYDGPSTSTPQSRQLGFTVPRSGHQQVHTVDRKKTGRSKGVPVLSLGKYLDRTK